MTDGHGPAPRRRRAGGRTRATDSASGSTAKRLLQLLERARLGEREGADAGTSQSGEVTTHAERRRRGRGRGRGRRCRSCTRRGRRRRRRRRPGGSPARRTRLTVTGRGGSSTDSPARTRAYDRTPSTLIADTDDGTCRMSPVSAATPAAIRRRRRRRPPRPPATLALGVVGDRRDPEPDRRVVGLVVQGQVTEQLGRALDAEDEHAGRHRVERAGVTDPTGAGEPAHARHHVVRRQPGGLVDDDEPAESPASAHAARDGARSSSSSSSTCGTRYGSGSPA